MTALIQLKAIVFANKWTLEMIKQIDYENPLVMTTLINIRSNEPYTHMVFSAKSMGATPEEADLLAARVIIRSLLIMRDRAQIFGIKGLDTLISPPDHDMANIQLISNNDFQEKLDNWCQWHNFIFGPIIVNHIRPGVFESTISATRRSDRKVYQHSSKHQSGRKTIALACFNLYHKLADLHDLSALANSDEIGQIIYNKLTDPHFPRLPGAQMDPRLVRSEN